LIEAGGRHKHPIHVRHAGHTPFIQLLIAGFVRHAGHIPFIQLLIAGFGTTKHLV
jgi:hypothetical protein